MSVFRIKGDKFIRMTYERIKATQLADKEGNKSG